MVAKRGSTIPLAICCEPSLSEPSETGHNRSRHWPLPGYHWLRSFPPDVSQCSKASCQHYVQICLAWSHCGGLKQLLQNSSCHTFLRLPESPSSMPPKSKNTRPISTIRESMVSLHMLEIDCCLLTKENRARKNCLTSRNLWCTLLSRATPRRTSTKSVMSWASVRLFTAAYCWVYISSLSRIHWTVWWPQFFGWHV